MVRARIAEVLLGADQTCARLGEITLRPHQQSAVSRIEAALEEFGGVLLSDDVGMGKTFAATAMARRYHRTLVVAPAALRSMWQDALAMTKTSADLVTFERLSRGPAPSPPPEHDLVIVDEAHHARNPRTKRYNNLARLTRYARVLLLTATPIHNRRCEMVSLLSLFLGSRARTLSAAELARCVLRRQRDALDGSMIPSVASLSYRDTADNPGVVEELMALPPPIPVRDGGPAGALVGRGLVHQWASSEAALHEAIRRRIAKAAALAASLESGNYPTARELETWIYGEGVLQLAFPELLSSAVSNASVLLDSVRLHADGLEHFYARHRTHAMLDAHRAETLVDIRRAHPRAKIVAFAQYAETVLMLFSRLAPTGRVAVLTARGGFVAGGKLTRREILGRFAPRATRANSPSDAEQIDLLLTTDLLSEGVNLQDAEVVIHLDVPWTAARMEQRVGRVARMGSLHSLVRVYAIRPPSSAEALLGSEVLVQRKWSTARRIVGSSAEPPFAWHEPREENSALVSVPAKTERLRRILESWRGTHLRSPVSDTAVASVCAPRSGFVATVSIGERPLLLSSLSGRVSADVDSQISACLLSEGSELETRPEDYEIAVNGINQWFEGELASASAGVNSSQAQARARLLSRIDEAIQNAPPHLRSSRSQVASRARRVATRAYGVAVEAELASLTHSPLPDHEWLEAVAALDSTYQLGDVTHGTQTLMIHALLLMRESD